MATAAVSQEVSQRAGWSVFVGVLTVAIGLVMVLYPYTTALASTLFLGWALIFAGVAHCVFAFDSGTPGSFFLKLLVGILYGIAGIALVALPIAGVSTLTMNLGTMLIAEAVLVGAMGFSLPAGTARGGFLWSGAASLVLGLLIVFEWPGSSGWAIGTLVGAAVLFSGVTRTVISATIHEEAHELNARVRAA